MLLAATACPAVHAQTVTKEDVDAVVNETNLRVAKALADLVVLQKEAEVRKAIAEAAKSELAAKLPSTETKLIGGSVSSDKFGAAALVKAFDLAQEMATELCAKLPTETSAFVLYDAAAVQGVVSARAVKREMEAISKQLRVAQNTIDVQLN